MQQQSLLDFIENEPGLAPYAIDMYRLIDRQAEILISKKARENPADLRARTGTPFITENAKERADAIERDPTLRLWVLTDLRAWAVAVELEQHWISWYAGKVLLWSAAQKAPSIVPMMVEGYMEVTR